jgi:hypothetical protein
MTREDRTKAHQIIRETFKGAFETSAKEIAGEENQRIAIVWGRGGSSARRADKPKGRSRSPSTQYRAKLTIQTHRTGQNPLLTSTLHCTRPTVILKTVSRTFLERSDAERRICPSAVQKTNEPLLFSGYALSEAARI